MDCGFCHNHDMFYARKSHLHDDRYYTEGELDILLAAKAQALHIHSELWDSNGGAVAVKADSSGKVGIGTDVPVEKLDIGGVILSGNATAVTGSLVLAGKYGGENSYILTLGSHYSTAGSVLGYAVKTKNGAAGYVSSTGVNIARAALNLDNAGIHFLTAAIQTVSYGLDVVMSEKLAVLNGGSIGIGTSSPSAKLAINGGVNVGGDTNPGDDNLYVTGNCSALTFTDRTKYFEGDALKELLAIKGDKDNGIDHKTLPEFARGEVTLTTEIPPTKEGEEPTYISEKVSGRDLGAMISMLTVAVQQLSSRLEKLEGE